MAKINHIILEYKDCIASTGITPASRPPKAFLRRFVRQFRDVVDSRVKSMVDSPLVEILLITFLAVLANSSTWSEIAYFGAPQKKMAKKIHPFKKWDSLP